MSQLILTNKFKLKQTKEQAYNTDTVLLSDFIKIPKKCNQILDIGTGSGVLLLSLSYRTNSKLVGIEIQQNRVEQALENVRINKLEDRIEIINDDIKKYNVRKKYDLILTNPPFFKVNNNKKLSDNLEERIARHEVMLTLEELIESVNKLLKYRGHFYMIHRPERINEIIDVLNKNSLTVKNIRFIHPYKDSKANHVLIHAIKNGNEGTIVLPPLIMYDSKLKMSDEMKDILERF